jgi:hypothetical protein
MESRVLEFLNNMVEPCYLAIQALCFPSNYNNPGTQKIDTVTEEETETEIETDRETKKRDRDTNKRQQQR